jgi:hypothetical protein
MMMLSSSKSMLVPRPKKTYNFLSEPYHSLFDITYKNSWSDKEEEETGRGGCSKGRK